VKGLSLAALNHTLSLFLLLIMYGAKETVFLILQLQMRYHKMDELT